MWLKKAPSHKLINSLAQIAEKRGGVLLFVLPLIAIRLVLHPFFPVEDDWADFTLYFGYFLLGFVLYTDQRFQQAVRRDWLILLAGGVVCFAILLFLLVTSDPFAWAGNPGLPQFYLVWTLLTVFGWCWALFFLGLGMHKLDFTNATLDYCKEAILPVFVLHQPVIIVIAYYVVQMEASIAVKLPLVVFGSLAVTLGLYELVICHLGPLRALFGMKIERHQAKVEPSALNI
jgi:surface polysaccharide O-acyltransferase-like enzyme